MFVKISEYVYLNTDHIITIDVATNRIETTPGMQRTLTKDSPLIAAMIKFLTEKGGE